MVSGQGSNVVGRMGSEVPIVYRLRRGLICNNNTISHHCQLYQGKQFPISCGNFPEICEARERKWGKETFAMATERNFGQGQHMSHLLF